MFSTFVEVILPEGYDKFMNTNVLYIRRGDSIDNVAKN